jgi:hypothetical protein
MTNTKLVSCAAPRIRRIQNPDDFAIATADAQFVPSVMVGELELVSTVVTVYVGGGPATEVQAIMITAIGGGVVAAMACCGPMMRPTANNEKVTTSIRARFIYDPPLPRYGRVPTCQDIVTFVQLPEANHRYLRCDF